MRKYLILSIFLVLCILCAGCGNKENNKEIDVKPATETKQAEKEEKIDYSVFSGDYTLEELLKEDYIYGTRISLQITPEGKVIGSGTSLTENGTHIASISFTGKVKDNIIESTFDDDGWGHRGKIEIELSANFIDVTITYSGVIVPGWGIGEGTFRMIDVNTKVQRTLKDLLNGGLQVIDNQSFNTKFENFGTVKFISGIKRELGGEIFTFYLSDLNDNILYKLDSFTGTDTIFADQINCVAFYDLNNDGLRDILIIASYKNFEGEYVKKAGIYFQNGNEFKMDESLNGELNASGKNDNMENVLSFLKYR